MHRKINCTAVLLVEEPVADTRRWHGHPTCCPRQQSSTAYLPQHSVLELMPVTSGARSSVQAHSLAIALTSFTTSLVVPQALGSNIAYTFPPDGNKTNLRKLGFVLFCSRNYFGWLCVWIFTWLDCRFWWGIER